MDDAKEELGKIEETDDENEKEDVKDEEGEDRDDDDDDDVVPLLVLDEVEDDKVVTDADPEIVEELADTDEESSDVNAGEDEEETDVDDMLVETTIDAVTEAVLVVLVEVNWSVDLGPAS